MCGLYPHVAPTVIAVTGRRNRATTTVCFPLITSLFFSPALSTFSPFLCFFPSLPFFSPWHLSTFPRSISLPLSFKGSKQVMRCGSDDPRACKDRILSFSLLSFLSLIFCLSISLFAISSLFHLFTLSPPSSPLASRLLSKRDHQHARCMLGSVGGGMPDLQMAFTVLSSICEEQTDRSQNDHVLPWPVTQSDTIFQVSSHFIMWHRYSPSAAVCPFKSADDNVLDINSQPSITNGAW